MPNIRTTVLHPTKNEIHLEHVIIVAHCRMRRNKKHFLYQSQSWNSSPAVPMLSTLESGLLTLLGIYQISASSQISGHFAPTSSSSGTSSRQSRNTIMKPDNCTYLLFHSLLISHQLTALGRPGFEPGHHKLKHETCDCTHTAVQVKLVLSPNYWVLTPTV